MPSILIGVFLFCYNVNFSQNIQEPKFTTLSMDEGLNENTINCIIQDYKGFMWFGTNGGLSRFDGNHFTNFTSDANDSTSIGNNSVKVLFEDSNRNLWIGCYNGGLNKFNREQENFSRYLLKTNFLRKDDAVLSISESPEGILWIGTHNGLVSFDPINKEIINLDYSFVDNQNDLLKREVFATYFDKNNNLLIGAINKVGKYNTKTFEFIPYFTKYNMWVNKIIQHSNGNYWFGTFKNGLYEFSENKGEINHFSSNNVISSLYEDNDNNLWIGIQGMGVKVLDTKTSKLQYIQNDETNQNSLSSNIVYSIYQDKTGVLWIGTNNGVNVYNAGKKKFYSITHKNDEMNSLPNYRVNSISKDSSGNFWVSLWGGGVTKISPDFKSYKHYRNNPDNENSIVSDFIRKLKIDYRGNVWIISDGAGISILNPGTDEIYNYSAESKNKFPDNFTVTLFEDSYKRMWIGSWHMGLILCSLDENYFLTTRVFGNNPFESSSLSNNIVTDINEDNQDNLWISTKGGGLNKLEGINNLNKEVVFKHFKNIPNQPNSLSTDEIHGTFQDAQGNLWICTNGKGLQKLNISKQQFTTYTKKEGLPSNNVLEVVEDKSDILWIATSNGLAMFNQHNNIIQYFDDKDGLISRDFSIESSCKDSNYIYFGTNKGIVFFNPSEIVIDTVYPNVSITNLKIFSELVKIGETIEDRVILKKSIIESKEIILSHKESVFSLEFAALQYTSPGNNKFSYRLLGFEENWQFTQSPRNFATYTNLDPGEYTFEVTTSSNNGIWNPVSTKLHIIITPPFWLEWWFKSIIVIFIIVIIYLIYKFRIYTLSAINKELEKRVEERTENLNELNKELTDFSYIVSHDLKAPLRGINQIIGWIAEDYEDVLDEDGKKNIEHLKSRVNKMNDLIQGILDYSRAGRQYEKVENVNLNTALENAITLFAPDVKSKITIENELPTITGTETKIVQVFQNLISNALTYNDKDEPKIFISSKEVDGYYEISIKDNGPGINKEHHERIFGMFQSLDKADGSTGVGLTIVKKIVESFKGKIKVISPNADGCQGTTFVVEFPTTRKT